MTKAIHFINKRQGASLIGLSKWGGVENGWRSCCWLLSDDDAAALIGGWVYLHGSKSEKSSYGGQIIGFEQGEEDAADRKVILFKANIEARNRAWRGADHGMAYTSGVIDADMPHESKLANP